MTKREILNLIVTALGESRNFTSEETEAIIAYATNEISLLEKKAEKAKSQKSKTQKENEVVKAQLLEYLNSINCGVTNTEIIKGGDTFSDFSTQKISALLEQLIERGEVVKIVYKKESYFAAAKWFSISPNYLT